MSRLVYERCHYTLARNINELVAIFEYSSSQKTCCSSVVKQLWDAAGRTFVGVTCYQKDYAESAAFLARG